MSPSMPDADLEKGDSEQKEGGSPETKRNQIYPADTSLTQLNGQDPVENNAGHEGATKEETGDKNLDNCAEDSR
jgi:hypothetical protein